jgi:3-hydroxyisobutyrate dehydrogenase
VTLSDTLHVGFIGLGDMGAPIAHCLLRAGYELTVYDLREEALLTLLEAGANRGTSPSDVVRRSDSVGICVVNEVQLREVFFGPEGLAPFLDASKSVFVTSSVEPDAVRSIAAEVQHTGAAIVDAPVSGSRPAAAAGTLSVLVGGSDADVERVDPVLRAFGKEIYHLGPVGAGQSMKIANNVMLHMNHLIVLEALRFARSQGLDESSVIEVANASTGNSWVTQTWGILDDMMEDHPQAGTDGIYTMMSKEMWNAVRLARTSMVAMPLTALGTQLSKQYFKEREEDVGRARDEGEATPRT